MGETGEQNRTASYRSSHLERGGIYDDAIQSAAFDAYLDRVERRHLRRLLPGLFPHGIPRYVDFACGTGRITSEVAPRARWSLGIDVSASMIERARAKCPGTRFVVRDITVDPLSLQPADLVTAFRFLGNAEPELRRSALDAIRGLLRPGGYLIANNHRNAGSLHSRLLRRRGRSDGADLTPRLLDTLLRDAGFAVESLTGIGAWIVRYGLRRPEVLGSRWAGALEQLSRLPAGSRLSPDVIVVARRG